MGRHFGIRWSRLYRISHTVYELIDAGENVVIVGIIFTGFRKAVHPEAKFYQG